MTEMTDDDKQKIKEKIERFWANYEPSTDEDEDDDEECCGKHCSETNNLTLAMGWYRYASNEYEMIKEQLFCELCIEDYTTSRCKACSETYKYTEMKYKTGGRFGEDNNSFFCIACIKYINSVEIDPDEYN